MSTHPGISSFMCSIHNPAAVSPCASRTSYGRLAGDLFVPLLYGMCIPTYTPAVEDEELACTVTHAVPAADSISEGLLPNQRHVLWAFS
jgi:hypothetical protein